MTARHTYRVQVDDFSVTRRTTVVYVAPPDGLDRLRPVVGRLTFVDRNAHLAFIAVAAERLADTEAYEREAMRRGVLPL